jgi:hypothetical protein
MLFQAVKLMSGPPATAVAWQTFTKDSPQSPRALAVGYKGFIRFSGFSFVDIRPNFMLY